MAGGLPPPPTKAESDSFAWSTWYTQLYSTITQAGAIAWDVISKAGSSLQDLQDRNHIHLTNVLGTGSNHISVTEAGRVTLLPVVELLSLDVDPTVTEIPTDTYAMYKNTTSGVVKLWVNDGGVMKSVTLT